MKLEPCPHCGARNVAGSRWCGQCLGKLGEPEPPPPAPPPAASQAAPHAPALGGVSAGLLATAAPGTATTEGVGSAFLSTALAGAASAQPSAQPPSASGPARTSSTTFASASADPSIDALRRATWICPRCDGQNTYADDVCSQCGSGLFEPLHEKKELRQVPSEKVTMASLAPGGGFFALGQPGQGVIRFALVAWALLIAIFLPRQLLWLKILFILAALAVWAISGLDALATQRGDESSVILKSRIVVFVVGGLIAILFIALVTSARTPGPGQNVPDGPIIIEGAGRVSPAV